MLGYILDGNLNMTGTMTVNAGDIVKIRNGTINLKGGRLRADDLNNSGQKVFTSLGDTTAGVGCPAALVPGCPAPAAGDWGGINLTNGTDATLVNAAVRYASTGILINSGAMSTYGSSSFGQHFTDSITGDLGTKPMIDIMKSTDWFEQQPWIDKDRMAAAGGSYGGYMVAYLNGHTDKFKVEELHFGSDAMFAAILPIGRC